jgi:hypothetical protein
VYLYLLPAVFLFVGSAAYTLTNMRDELTDVLYNDDDTISEALAALGFAGFGLGEESQLNAISCVGFFVCVCGSCYYQ